MSKNAIVYGNGESRKEWDITRKFNDTETWGCNRIYEEGVQLDNLVCVDYIRQHEVYKSGYAFKNKCWFLDWHKQESIDLLDSEVYYQFESLLGAIIEEYGDSEYLNKSIICDFFGTYIQTLDTHHEGKVEEDMILHYGDVLNHIVGSWKRIPLGAVSLLENINYWNISEADRIHNGLQENVVLTEDEIKREMLQWVTEGGQ